MLKILSFSLDKNMKMTTTSAQKLIKMVFVYINYDSECCVLNLNLLQKLHTHRFSFKIHFLGGEIFWHIKIKLILFCCYFISILLTLQMIGFYNRYTFGVLSEKLQFQMIFW